MVTNSWGRIDQARRDKLKEIFFLAREHDSSITEAKIKRLLSRAFPGNSVLDILARPIEDLTKIVLE